MHDERVESRALLGFKDFRDSGGIECVRSEAINGFGRQSDDFAFAEQPYGLLDRLVHERWLVGGQNGGDEGGNGHERRKGQERMTNDEFVNDE